MSYSKEIKFENDKMQIDFLNQCKFELSAEVIRWKEENLKLRKENECISKKSEELQSLVTKLSRQTHEMETSLFLSHEENKRLRMHTLTIGEENSILHDRLSKSKLNSFQWSDLKNKSALRCSQSEAIAVEDSITVESCDDVSAKLLIQMQKEIKEMQDFQNSLTQQDNVEQLEPSNLTSLNNEENVSKMAQKVVDLTTEVEMLKRRMKLQNEKLRFLLNGDIANSDINSNTKIDANSGSTQSAKTAVRPSDETFRAYFIQQLRNTKENSEQIRKKTLSNKEEPKLFHGATTKSGASNVQYQIQGAENNSPSKSVNKSEQDTKVCPICKVIFTMLIDREFEEHVISHLEAAGESLLTQYEVV